MKLTQLALACALTGALAACGGGSSSNGADSGGSGGGTTRTLSGVAAKGLIKNGIVEVFSYDAAGKKSAQPLVTARTSTIDGSYSVDLGSNVGLFTIEVRADAATTMADEVSHKDIAMPAGLTLRSLVQLDGNASGAIKGYVTPFTDMLVKAAESAGGLTASNVATAQTGVITMLGFNPLTTKPINADSPAAAAVTDQSEQLQSLALAAISRLASNGSLGCAQATVSEKIKCVVDATTGSANLNNGTFNIPLTAQIALAAALKTVVADPAINKTTLATLDGKSTFTQASVPTTGTAENPIAAAKALFASLRTNIQAWSAAFNGGAAATSLNTMKTNFDMAIAPVDQELADWVLISDSGVAMFNNYVNSGNNGASNAPVYGNSGQVGNCYLYSDTGSSVEVSNHVNANNVFCRLNKSPVPGTEASLSRPNASPATTLTRQQFTKTIKLTPASPTSFGYETRSRMETAYFNRPSGIVTDLSIDTSKQLIGLLGTGTVSFANIGNTTTTIALAGDMPARTTNMGVAITDKETWNVNFKRTLEADNVTTNYAVSGGITAYKAGVAISAITLKDGSFIRAKGQDLQEVQLSLDVASKASKVAGILYLGTPKADKRGGNIIPTVVRFTGSFSNGGTEFFNGQLAATAFNYPSYDGSTIDTSANFLNATVSFAGIAKIPGRPDLKLNLSASNPAFATQAFSGQYDDGTNVILVNGSNATGKQIVDVFSANGVAMHFVTGVNKVEVMKNNSIIASFDQSSGNISYTDGSLESLK